MIGIRCYEMLGLDVSLDTDFMLSGRSNCFPCPFLCLFTIYDCLMYILLWFFFNDLVLWNKGTWVRVFCHIALLFWNELCNVSIHPHLNAIDDSNLRLIALIEISTIATHCKTTSSKDPSIHAVRILETENKAFQTGAKI